MKITATITIRSSRSKTVFVLEEDCTTSDSLIKVDLLVSDVQRILGDMFPPVYSRAAISNIMGKRESTERTVTIKAFKNPDTDIITAIIFATEDKLNKSVLDLNGNWLPIIDCEPFFPPNTKFTFYPVISVT